MTLKTDVIGKSVLWSFFMLFFAHVYSEIVSGEWVKTRVDYCKTYCGLLHTTGVLGKTFAQEKHQESAPKKVIPVVFREIRRLTCQENPPTQRDMAQIYHLHLQLWTQPLFVCALGWGAYIRPVYYTFYQATLQNVRQTTGNCMKSTWRGEIGRQPPLWMKHISVTFRRLHTVILMQRGAATLFDTTGTVSHVGLWLSRDSVVRVSW